MSANQHTTHHDADQQLYSLDTAARLARVTVAFIQECEREELIAPTEAGNTRGYVYSTVCRLIRIRHLHWDLGFDLSTIDCMLRMRRQVIHLQRRLEAMEQQMAARERELMDEIQSLRRKIAYNSHWQNS